MLMKCENWIIYLKSVDFFSHYQQTNNNNKIFKFKKVK